MRPRARNAQTSGQRIGFRLVEHPQHNAVIGLDRPVSELVELAPPSGDELQAIVIARNNHPRFARGVPEPVDPPILDPFTASEVDELSAVAGELDRVDAGRAECVDAYSPPAQTSRVRDSDCFSAQ